MRSSVSLLEFWINSVSEWPNDEQHVLEMVKPKGIYGTDTEWHLDEDLVLSTQGKTIAPDR